MIKLLINMKLGTKIYAIVGVLSLVAAAIAGLGLSAMQTYNRLVGEMEQASQRAVVAAQINALVFAAVMDSRGLYIARDRAEAEKFGNPLLKTLADMRQLMGDWRALMPPARRGELDNASASLADFVKFRTELVRLGVEEGAKAARFYGDNDANRTNRQTLNQDIDGLTFANKSQIGELNRAIEQHYMTTMLELIGLAVLGVLSAAGLSMATVIGFITRPLAALTRAMKELADGTVDLVIPGTGRGDELGDMSRAVLVFQESMSHAAALDEARRRENDAKEARRLALDALVRDFGNDIDGVVRAVTASASSMSTTAASLTATADETTRQTAAVASAAEQASTNVQTVASAAEELDASISEIGRQVSHSAEIAGKAVAEANRSDREVAALAAAAQKIGEVVALIHDIASQTNLLALNATIEAARAGEAGKGFAVVASEVKGLANQTARATEDIEAQVAAIQGATGGVVTAIRGIGTTIAEMNEIATSIAAAIEQQGAATREIAGNVQQAAAGTNEVSSNIAGITEAAVHNGRGAQHVLGAARALAEQADTLRSRVETFAGAVRAA